MMRRAETESAPNGAKSRREDARVRVAPEVDLQPLLVLAGVLFVALLLSVTLSGRAAAEAPVVHADAPAAVEVSPAAPSPEALERLLEVPNAHALGRRVPQAQSADEAIAAAIRNGAPDRPVRASGFRKRNVDLFRSEHPVEIGEQEMLLRLRLRARSRETMSVELRF